MPREPIIYQKTIIYKIVCKDLSITDTYVGHTTNFVKRQWNHKYNCNSEKSKSYNFKIYQIIRENGGWENWEMIEIEKYPCNDVNEACARERFWYEELNAKLNMTIPNRTDKEYYADNRDAICQKSREYKNNNIEKVNLKKKEFYIKNKEKILYQQSLSVLCACGKTYTRCHKSRHFKSKHHINFVETTTEPTETNLETILENPN